MWSRTHHMSLSSCPQTWSSASCSSTTTQASPGQACPTLPTPPIPPAKRAPPSTPSRPPTGRTAAVRPGRPATNRSTCTHMSCRGLTCMFSVLYWPLVGVCVCVQTVVNTCTEKHCVIVRLWFVCVICALRPCLLFVRFLHNHLHVVFTLTSQQS